MLARDCPTCRGMHLDGRARCPSCGHSLGDRLPVIPRWAMSLHERFIAGRRPERIALVPAAVPLLLPLPALALCWAAISLLRLGGTAGFRAAMETWAPVILLAVVNVAISAWLISSASREILDGLLWIWGQVLSPLPPAAETPGIVEA